MAEDALTRTAVTRLLQERLDPRLECVSVSGGVVGNGQETWFVEAAADDGVTRRLVIRRTAVAGTQEDTDREREFAMLELVGRKGLPVPRVHWLEVEPSALGRPYFVMDRAPGHTPTRATELERRAIARQIGEWLAHLHELDVAEAPPQLPRADDAAAATRAELERWRQQYLRTRPGSIPPLGALLAWLEVELPVPPQEVRLLWGDPGPHNVLVEGQTVTGLLDWEQTHLGHPLEDLGAAVWGCLDRYDPDDVIGGYEAVAGPVDRSVLRYFEVFACVSRAIMIAGGVSAYLGRRATPSLAALGQQLLLASLVRAAEAAGWGALPQAPPAPPARRLSPVRLRPDVPEIADGVARFLRREVIDTVEDRRLRGQLKTAAALLETVVTRSTREPSPGDGDDGLEEAAARAEREQSPERDALRGRLLAWLAEQRALIGPLEELYRP